MDFNRYVIEAKDEHGWFDYSTLSRKTDAIRIARELKESFGNNLRVIDKQNMLEVDFSVKNDAGSDWDLPWSPR